MNVSEYLKALALQKEQIDQAKKGNLVQFTARGAIHNNANIELASQNEELVEQNSFGLLYEKTVKVYATQIGTDMNGDPIYLHDDGIVFLAQYVPGAPAWWDSWYFVSP
jgi:hypothetical protein